MCPAWCLRMYGNCVFWRSKRQDIIIGDTTEAELIAMSSAANELMWIKQLCTDLSITAKKPTPTYRWTITLEYLRIFPCRQSACAQAAVSSHASAIASAQSGHACIVCIYITTVSAICLWATVLVYNKNELTYSQQAYVFIRPGPALL